MLFGKITVYYFGIQNVPIPIYEFTNICENLLHCIDCSIVAFCFVSPFYPPLVVSILARQICQSLVIDLF